MKKFFSFLSTLIAILIAISAVLVGIGYFFNKKTTFFRNLFAKKDNGEIEE